MAKLGDTGRQPFAIFDQDDTKNVMKLALKKHFAFSRGNVVAASAAAAAALESADDAVGKAGDAGSEADDALAKQPPLREWVSPHSLSDELMFGRCSTVRFDTCCFLTVIRLHDL